MKRVYLAGPDVFYPDAWKNADEMKGYCTKYGLEGVFPLDATIVFPEWATGPTKADMIFDANINLIQSCDGVLANITPFRGPSLDVGTSWEMGFAYALGKPVVAYWTPDRDYKSRVEEAKIDDGLMVEDFDLVDNLMPICGSTIFDKPYRAAEHLAVLLGVHHY